MKRLLLLTLCLLLPVVGSFASNTKAEADTTEFSRGLSYKIAPVFMPKGYIMTGISAAFHNYGLGKYSLSSLLTDMTIDAYTLKASPFFYYFVADNQGVGARVSYRRTSANIGNVSLQLGEALGFDIADISYLQHSVEAAVAYRYYLQFGQSKRFGFFLDVNLDFAYGQSRFTQGEKQNPEQFTGTYAQTWDFGLSVNPGLCLFFNEHAALEVSVGVFGVNYTLNNQLTNQIENEGNFKNFNGHFSIDFLSVNIGIVMVIPHHKKKAGK